MDGNRRFGFKLVARPRSLDTFWGLNFILVYCNREAPFTCNDNADWANKHVNPPQEKLICATRSLLISNSKDSLVEQILSVPTWY